MVLNGPGTARRVTVSYTDVLGHTESLLSDAKSIQDPNGNLVINLMQISAPEGSWVINPLTTVLKNALDLGLSPNMAMKAVREVFGLSPELNLLHYDPYLVLMSSPSDPVALKAEVVAMQIAVLTSIADDDQAINLTLKTIEAAQIGRVLDLSVDQDLVWITGLATTSLEFQKIKTKNNGLTRALDSKNGDVFDIEKEWQDFLKLQDGIASTSIADLNIHINQGPQGSSPASLTAAVLDTPYLVSSAALLAGLSDPEADALSVTQMQVDQGGVVSKQPDGSFVFTPTPGYLGPVELTYTVADPHGVSLTLSTLLIVDLPPNQAPTGEVSISGSPTQGETLSVIDTLVDPDGMGPVSYSWAANGTVVGAGTSYTLGQSEVGKAITVSASYQDGYGRSEIVVSQASPSVLNLNDPLTGSLSISGNAQQGQTLTASSQLADIDGLGAVSYTWTADGAVIGSGETITLTQSEVGKAIALTASTIDGQGTAESLT